MTLTLNRIAAGLVGVAMVAGLAAAFTVERAHAAEFTLSELVELFIGLGIIDADKAEEARAAVEGMDDEVTTGGGVALSCNFTRNLSVGDTGADVMDLQKFLNASGYTVATAGAAGSAGNETQYYGPATAAAVTAMQNAYAGEILAPLGLSAGTGYFGASTRAKANALCEAQQTDEDDMPDLPDLPDMGDDEDEDMDEGDEEEMDEDEDLTGGEASYGSVTRASTPSSVEVSEGDEEVAVAAFEFDVDDADASLRRAYISFEETSSADNSNDPWDYFEEVHLWVNGEMVASEAADDEDDWEDISGSDRYEMRFTGLDEFLEADEEAEVAVSVTMRTVIDSTDEDAVWSVTIPGNGLRLRDGLDIDTQMPSTITTARDFSLESATEEDELKIRTDSSNPDSSVIKVDDNSDTDDVNILVFSLEAEGSDIEIREFPIELLTSDNDIDDVVSDVQFVVDGTSMGDISNVGVGTTTLFEFDNNEFIIDEGDTVTVEIVVDLKERDADTYAAGTTVEANVTSAERESIVAEGTEDLTATDSDDISGTADGESHQLLAEGVFAEIVSVDDDMTNEDTAGADKAVFKIRFDVTAFEDDFYVPFSAASTSVAADTSAGTNYRIEGDSGMPVGPQGTSTLVAGVTNTSGADTAGGSHWVVRDGETETFELSVTYGPNANGSYRAQLMFVNYATSTDTSIVSTHNAAPSEDFETGSVQITDN